MGQIKNIKLHIVTDIKVKANKPLINTTKMMSSRAATMLARIVPRTRSLVQPRQLSTTTQAKAVNDHAWAAFGADQVHADENMPFQTANTNRLLAWLCFWSFVGIAVPYAQTPFVIENPEEED